MSYAINDLLRFTVTLKDSRFSGKFKNIMHFRVYSGEVLDAVGMDLMQNLAENYWVRILNQLATDTYISHIRLQNLRKDSCPDQEVLYSPDQYPGQITVLAGDDPSMCAAFTKRAFRKGRKGIGHFYLGPLPSKFTSYGLIVPDPLLAGDLQDVMDALGDPLEATGIVCRPIVHADENVAPTALDDIRTVTLAEKTVYLKSRRPGVGE